MGSPVVFWVPALLVAWAQAGAAWGAVVNSTSADRKTVAVTVYNDGRGLVREERRVTLPAGTAELRFMDVAEKIEAATVKVSVLEGAGAAVSSRTTNTTCSLRSLSRSSWDRP
jgi:hypothetical protein